MKFCLSFDFQWRDVVNSSWLVCNPEDFITATGVDHQELILAHVMNLHGWYVRMAHCPERKFDTRDEAKLYVENLVKYRYPVLTLMEAEDD